MFAGSEFPTIRERYIDTNKVRWVIRHLPSGGIHDRAEPAARASEYVANQDPDAFFDYRDLILADQDDLSDNTLGEHASTLGLDRTTFDTCFSGRATAGRVQRDVESAAALGVNTIPTFLVNSEKVSGFHTAEELATVIDRHLNDD
jgi:protein-disulfide isomerase